MLAAAAPGVAQSPAPSPEFAASVLVAGFERPVEVRQSGLKRRVDVATAGVVQTFVADRARGSLTVMTAAGRRRVAFVFPMTFEETAPPLPMELRLVERSARVSKVGASTVAGRPCSLWRYAGWAGRNGVLCAAADGVILSFRPDGRTTPLFQVARIVYARQDPRAFAPPPDYQVAALPGIGGVASAPSATPAQVR